MTRPLGRAEAYVMAKLLTWSMPMPTMTLIGGYRVHSHSGIGQRATSSERSVRNALSKLEGKGLIIRTEATSPVNDRRPCVAWVRADREFLLDSEIDDDEKEWLNLTAEEVAARIRATGFRAVVTWRAADSLNTSSLTCNVVARTEET